MSYRIETEVTVTAYDPEEECDPRDLGQVGTHRVAFTCESLDATLVHASAIAALKEAVWIRYPDQFQFEVSFPEGAQVEPLPAARW